MILEWIKYIINFTMAVESPEKKGTQSGTEYNARLLNTIPDALTETGALAAKMAGSIFFSFIGGGIIF